MSPGLHTGPCRKTWAGTIEEETLGRKKNKMVKKACGIVLTGLLPPGCMAVIKPGTLLRPVVIAEALFFTKQY